MIKRITSWLTSIIRAEIERAYATVKADAAADEAKLRDLVEVIEKAFQAAVDDVKGHISAELAAAHEPLKTAVGAEITRNFENILSHTKVAAKEALAEARKTLRMVCSHCGVLSWKFIIGEEGKIVCGDCQSRGVK